MRIAAVVAAALILGISVTLTHAQQNPRVPGAGNGPSAVIDFVAVDAKGQAVRDLTAADLAIRIDGKARDVRGLRLVTSDAPLPLGVTAPDPLPPPFASNIATSAGSRAVFLIFDNETMAVGREQRIRDGVLALIKTLGPRDQAAIVTVPHGGASADLTTDHAMLRDAVNHVAGAAPLTETADEAACRSRLTVQSITAILERRAGAETPTDVVFVSSSLSGPRSSVSAGTTTLGVGSIGGCELPMDDFTKLGAAASAARARFYIVQTEPARATSTVPADSLRAGLENIASVTGGLILHDAGSDEPGFQRVATETASYYAATIELDPADRSATSRPLSIKTNRADVVIRARPTIGGTNTAGTTERRPAAVSPKDLLRTATVYRDVPIRIAAFAARNPGDGNVRIMALAEAAAADVRLAAASIGVYDPGGKLVSQWSANATELAAPALVTAFIQKPGRYRVRVAATDAAGRAGTADYDFNAALTPAAGVLTLSSMMIGTGGAGFTPKLQFTKESQALAYFELYGGKPGMPVSVAMELSATLNGPALMTLTPQISLSSEPDMYRVVAPITLSTLPAGDYVVRAVVGLDGQPAGRIVRTLRKVQ